MTSLSRKDNTAVPTNRTNWRYIIQDVISSLRWFSQLGVTPTLRTMFYRLVSMEVIPNTEQSYKTLSFTTVKARKTGELPWDCFSDQGRQVLVGFKGQYTSPEEFVQVGINYLKNASHSYIQTIPRWYEQKHYIEIWIEKQALADTFVSFLQNRQVNIVVNRGYAGWSFLYKNCKRLRRKKDQYGKFSHVLYFGDFDPSGEDMDRHLQNAIEQFGLQDAIDFKRVAVTLTQIEKFNLPPIPSNHETLDKISKDTRTIKFKEKYGGKLYAVELDALLAVSPDQFRIMVQRSVDQFFDDMTYKRVLREHSPSLIERLVNKRIRFLD